MQGFGGSYNPDFGFESQLDFQKRNQWGTLLDYICGDSKDEKVSSVIKTMKARKEIERVVKDSRYKDMLAENENIFKSYVMEKTVLPKLKRDSRKENIGRGSIFRIDTVSAMNNLIHQKTFLNEMKKKQGTRKGRNRFKNLPISPPSGKKVTFNDTDPNISQSRSRRTRSSRISKK